MVTTTAGSPIDQDASDPPVGTRQSTLKGVTVRVAQARDQAVCTDIVVADRSTLLDRLNTAGRDR